MVAISGARYLTPKEAAARFELSYRTMMRHLTAGQIPGAFRLGGDGPWRVPLVEVPMSEMSEPRDKGRAR